MEISGDFTKRMLSTLPSGLSGAGQAAKGAVGSAASAGITDAVKKMGAHLAPARGSTLESTRVPFSNGTPPGRLAPPRGGGAPQGMMPQGGAGGEGGMDAAGAKGGQEGALGGQADKSAESESVQQKHDIVMKFIEGARG